MSTSTAAQPAFDPANFVTGQPIDNPYLPWKPGTTFLYHTYLPGNVLEQIDTVTVTANTKKIDGVICTAVSDNVTDPKTGAFIEKTTDYYAQDKSGNVWYFGEASAEFVNGKVDKSGSWLAGTKGALPGIIQVANPQVGDSYDEENAPNVAHDHGVVTSLTGSASVPFGTFRHDLLVVHETSSVEPGAAEDKYYRAGVGEVFGKDLVSGEEDRLVSVTTDTGTSQLVQAMASFGGGGPSLNSSALSAAANDTALQHMLAANGQHG
jgi:hypothetical protein